MVLSLVQYSQLCPPMGPCLSPAGAEAPGARHAGRVRIVRWFPPLETDSECVRGGIRDLCTRMFIIVLFIILKNWK